MNPVDDTPADDPADRPRPSNAQALVLFEQALHDSGPRSALCLLNGFTDHRYTGVFRFAGGFAHSLFHVDRVNPEIHAIPGIPEQTTCCCLVRDTEGHFVTLDALIDERLDDHPARTDVRGYCGTPLLDPEGQLLGTLCHFDELPREPHALDLPLLQRTANAFVASGFSSLPALAG